jgi:hypothetical protein
MRCCSRGPLGRLLGVKTNAEMDRPGGYYIYEIASSAEGATFTSKPGAAPQGYENQKKLALKARFISGTPVGSASIESRFQRLFAWRFEFLGRCPRLDFEIAPLAL